jgi:isopenicillin N synthase-like dioxygenase
VNLEVAPSGIPTHAVASAVTDALKNSGFLLVKSPELPLELQQKALRAASEILHTKSSSTVITHPTDPKIYAMLNGIDFNIDGTVSPEAIQDLTEWYRAVRSARDILLKCIAIGLGVDDPNFFVTLHNQHNDSLRLLRYHPGDETTGNRCKEHSDYGTLTLLLTDGVGGLEAFVDGEWKPVPYVEGAIVVNIGSILSEWTGHQLSATLHRVAGPASLGSNTPMEALMRAVSVPRISIAYFADPNADVHIALQGDEENSMKISDYILMRSGGIGRERDGVAFTTTEKDRLEKS